MIKNIATLTLCSHVDSLCRLFQRKACLNTKVTHFSHPPGYYFTLVIFYYKYSPRVNLTCAGIIGIADIVDADFHA